MKIVVKSTNTWPETTSGGTVLTKQQAAMDVGKDYPIPFELTIENGTPYNVGEYTLDPSAFRVSRYKSLELDPYGIRLIPVRPEK